MNPKLRQTAYLIGLISTSAITLASLWHGISGGTASSLTNGLAAILGLLGVGATGTASVAVTKQMKDGTLDFTGSAAEQAVAAIQATVNQASQATNDLARVQQAIVNQAAQIIPGAGPIIAAGEAVGGQLVDQLIAAVLAGKK
jgi:hypothetical protein